MLTMRLTTRDDDSREYDVSVEQVLSVKYVE